MSLSLGEAVKEELERSQEGPGRSGGIPSSDIPR
ncbi:hypothetical protein GA0115260_106404 [Streptomyces sp. MnatMP-M27]|nr:hypothetical protein GA0115260_106404 [Streptomyces sp. MnatMP-M27]